MFSEYRDKHESQYQLIAEEESMEQWLHEKRMRTKEEYNDAMSREIDPEYLRSMQCRKEN